MGVSNQTRSRALAEVLASERKTLSGQMHVALPGIIQSFDPESLTAVAQPAVRYIEYDNDGNKGTKDYPLLVDVPVVFPRRGGCALTFPVGEGGECLVILADRCIDFWWQSGGVQEPVDGRMHGSSDAFCIVGPRPQAKKIGGISTTGVQLRTDDGSAFIEVIVGEDITATIAGSVTINTPEIVLNGNVTISGNPSQGAGERGGTATIHGPITVTNDVAAGGKSLMMHMHGGVKHDNDSTGGPE